MPNSVLNYAQDFPDNIALCAIGQDTLRHIAYVQYKRTTNQLPVASLGKC